MLYQLPLSRQPIDGRRAASPAVFCVERKCAINGGVATTRGGRSVLLTILLPMKPATSPTTIHEMMPIVPAPLSYDFDPCGPAEWLFTRWIPLVSLPPT